MFNKKTLVIVAMCTVLLVAASSIVISVFVKQQRRENEKKANQLANGKRVNELVEEFKKHQLRLNEVAIDFNTEYDKLNQDASNPDNLDKPGFVETLERKMHDLSEIGKMGYNTEMELQKIEMVLRQARKEGDAEKLERVRQRLQEVGVDIEKVKKKLDEYKKSA